MFDTYLKQNKQKTIFNITYNVDNKNCKRNKMTKSLTLK